MSQLCSGPIVAIVNLLQDIQHEVAYQSSTVYAFLFAK